MEGESLKDWNLRKRAEAAAQLLSIRFPFPRNYRPSRRVFASIEIALFIVYQPFKDNSWPTEWQVSKALNHPRSTFHVHARRVKRWDSSGTIETVLSSKILQPQITPMSESEIFDIYRVIRQSEGWPWRRGNPTGTPIGGRHPIDNHQLPAQNPASSEGWEASR